MKTFFRISLLLLFLGVIAWTFYFLYSKSKVPPITYETLLCFDTSIVKKTVAAGSVIPRKEINIKSQVSGIIEKLYVVAGKEIKEGDIIAKIKIVPNMLNLSNAESRINQAQLRQRLSEEGVHQARVGAAGGADRPAQQPLDRRPGGLAHDGIRELEPVLAGHLLAGQIVRHHHRFLCAGRDAGDLRAVWPAPRGFGDLFIDVLVRQRPQTGGLAARHRHAGASLKRPIRRAGLVHVRLAGKPWGLIHRDRQLARAA